MNMIEVAEEAARIGGAVLEDWGDRFTAREKNPSDLVTEADLASQEAIFELIIQHFPDHGFLGEEGLNRESDSPYRWIIDPLDGTSNYVHRFPYYAVSIGWEKDGELVGGVIFDPTRNEMFSAATGQGATLNGKKIAVTQTDVLSKAMCMASLPVSSDRDHPAIKAFLDVLEVAQTVQRTGSAALNLCNVACGRIEAFWSVSLKPWDMAAGALIVREAGGTVTKLDESEFDVEVPDLLATNGTALHSSLAEILS